MQRYKGCTITSIQNHRELDLWAFPYWMDAWERESPMVQRGFREAHMKLTKDTRFRYSICRSCGYVRNDGLWKSAAMRINEKSVCAVFRT